MAINDTRDPKWRLRRHNSSGYQGVSFAKNANKWAAYIRVDGKRKYLGLFATAEAASEAYQQAEKALRPQANQSTPEEIRSKLLTQIRRLYDLHGTKALSTTFLEKQKGALYPNLLAAGLGQPEYLGALGLVQEFAEWRDANRTYRGKTKPTWTWKVAVDTAKQVKAREGDLPTMEWFRRNNYHGVVNAVFKTGRTWDDLREAVGSSASSPFYPSRNGWRWRSRPEACLSNFLYARGIAHKRGERYPESYATQSGRRYGRFDMHFQKPTGEWVNVEVWGNDALNTLSGGRYTQTRAYKEKFHANSPNFLGIPGQDCLRDELLAAHLRPFIGDIKPSNFDTTQDRLIETSHWTDGVELLETCRQLATSMPDGIFPNEQWLRKRGKYADRPGDAYNTMAVRVNQWLGGTRKVRALLDQADASTTAWTKKSAIKAWRDFEAEYGLSPTQLTSKSRQANFATVIVRRANSIREACRRLGITEDARGGKTARKVTWTTEHTITQWQDFERRHGLSPSAVGSAKNRRTLPLEVYRRGTRIYNAANRLGLIDQIKN